MSDIFIQNPSDEDRVFGVLANDEETFVANLSGGLGPLVMYDLMSESMTMTRQEAHKLAADLLAK